MSCDNIVKSSLKPHNVVHSHITLIVALLPSRVDTYPTVTIKHWQQCVNLLRLRYMTPIMLAVTDIPTSNSSSLKHCSKVNILDESLI